MRYCMVCKIEIEADRIEAIPRTRLCTRHGREIEQFGGEFRLTATQERTSKKGSLKLNYGGISTNLERNTDAMDQMLDEYERQQFEE